MVPLVCILLFRIAFSKTMLNPSTAYFLEIENSIFFLPQACFLLNLIVNFYFLQLTHFHELQSIQFFLMIDGQRKELDEKDIVNVVIGFYMHYSLRFTDGVIVLKNFIEVI